VITAAVRAASPEAERRPAASTGNPPPDAAYLRGNPHRFGLGRIGLETTHADGSRVAITDLKNINERLGLWGGVATSSFEVDGTAVHVRTVVHSQRDGVGILEVGAGDSQEWRVRLGLKSDEQWQKAIENLAPLTVRIGIYPALEIPIETNAATMTTWLYGALPGRGIDKDARNTLHAVTRTTGRRRASPGARRCWRCAQPGWMSLTGRFDYWRGLLKKTPSNSRGCTVRRPEQTPMYMSANDGWLSAVAMMAAGWGGHTGHVPGFPKKLGSTL